MPSDTRDAETHVLRRLEAAIVYCWDFSNENVVAKGAVLSAPTLTITDGAALVTMGTPAVITEAFDETDENGNVADTVAIGKGVAAAITPGNTKGQCSVTCKVAATLNSVVSYPVRVLNFKVL